MDRTIDWPREVFVSSSPLRNSSWRGVFVYRINMAEITNIRKGRLVLLCLVALCILYAAKSLFMKSDEPTVELPVIRYGQA
jgi:hypothetical protein